MGKSQIFALIGGALTFAGTVLSIVAEVVSGQPSKPIIVLSKPKH